MGANGRLTDIKVYFIPGLAADRRMYEPQLKIGLNAEVLEHDVPKKDESFKSYIKRFSKKIDTKKPFILVGTSLGGIMSVELAKIVKPEKVILISSVKSRKELPRRIRIMKYIPVHRLFKGKFFKKLTVFGLNFLGARKSKNIKKIIKDMLADADPYFIEWAIDRVINWENKSYNKDILHIHGDSDNLFPIKHIDYTVSIMKGSHVMIAKQHELVNDFLLKMINEKQHAYADAES